MGTGDGVDTTPAMTYTGDAASDAFGAALAGAGDLEGDGLNEVLIGAYGIAEVTIIRGNDDVTAATITTLSGSYRFGESVAGAGDVNGDGYGDIVVGAPGTGGTSAFYVYYGCPDADQDGWCTSEDCDDEDADIYPDAADTEAGGVDSDCDGQESCYADADEDGYRSDTLTTSSDGDCDDTGEALEVDPSGDCDDADADIWPGADEVRGDEVDQDCDGGEICYQDGDGDGYGTVDEVTSTDSDCADPKEAPQTETFDCDDEDAAVSPAAEEIPGDGTDQDCDGEELCYADMDADGYRTDETVMGASLACDSAGEATADVPDGDCNDSDAAVNPSATEITGDEVDQNCDGMESCFVDSDADTYTTTGTLLSLDSDCADPGEYTDDWPTGDCDDSDPDRSPGAEEIVGDELDSNCDGVELCYADADRDDYRIDDTVASVEDADCQDPGEAVMGVFEGDCDDTDPTVHVYADEIVGDEVDQDCDGAETCYVDADGDGHRPDASSTVGSEDADCADDGEATADLPADDCNDANPNVYPGAAELDDELDNDCDLMSDPKDSGCGCASAGHPPGLGALLPLAALALLRRQRRRTRLSR